MRSLRIQLLFSHLALVALMGVVMASAVVNFLHLGRSVDRIIRNNYNSVIAAQNMKEALERIDSANAYILAGQRARARQQYRVYLARFETACQVEERNITEPGEKAMAADIARRLWPAYRSNTEEFLFGKPPMRPDESRAYYFRTLQPQFEQLKQRSQDVLDLNQAAIVMADRRARSEAEHASRVAISLTIGALVLALFFALRMIGSSLTPLRSLARQAEEIGAGHLNQSIELHRNDEIGNLADSFNHMAESLREARRREEERLHRAQRMSDEALESLYDPVVVTDAEGRVLHLNRAAEGLFGPASHAAGVLVSQAVNDERIAQAVDRAIRQERVSAEEGESAFIPVVSGETERTYRLRVTPMHDSDGTLLGAVAVLEDVTHLRHLDRLKTEFISVASHELRTPVTSLLLSAQLLEEEAAGPLTPDQRAVVAAQKQDLERLERLMGDLLDLTRIEAGVDPPRFEFVSPCEMVAAAIEPLVPQALARGLVLEHDVPDDLPQIRADRAQAVRVLVNLLSNALRHTSSGGRVTLAAFTTGTEVAFRVEDTGAGIPREYLPRIFDRFVQVPGATRGGAGLGLSIAKTIVTAHGGRIWAESELGQGSVFTCTFPVAGLVPGAGKE